MTHLEKGDTAPAFTSKDQNGNEISLSDYKGKKVALYFYPKDMTPGCTNQACNLRDHYEALQKHEIVVLGVSPDDETRHQKFIDKHELPFPLIADTEKEVIQAYGIWGLKKFMGKEYDGLHRTTFLISEEGKIHDIIKKPKTKAHAEEILEKFDL
ncbi:thioredoxin-dependent thiol peroxidase [Brumimicrobium salinarum]|uniref:thioredoxin-dependent peroxiredoxin n=1 Tax=Brumimicrobium salinarum TaxID=2058658 RepID=A0A2I0R6C9_9FLAO|nr:thioredoxin-dependent thiol peroxidase [Brumimicrobium salinarum]PKR82127.1 thioredoxin-dependent thiol peroxidase [Brumimicrobium salinarum]